MTQDVVVGHTRSTEVEQAMAQLTRCEDVTTSPNGKLLALAGYENHVVLLVDLHVTLDPLVAIDLGAVTELAEPSFDLPHGVEFLDDETLLVASRRGGIDILMVRRGDGAVGSTREVVPAAVSRSFDHLRGPGSLAVLDSSNAGAEILVSNSSGHTVTHHRLDRTDGCAVVESDVVLQRWLDIPDGMAASSDGWVAVSNHNSQTVNLYRRDQLGPEAEPAGILREVTYPHGLQFTADGRHLLVADAGSPHVVIFRQPAHGWDGRHHPIGGVRVIDNDAFSLADGVPEEGGPKGLHLFAGGRLLAVTSANPTLTFVDVSAAIDAAERGELPVPDVMRFEHSVLNHQKHRGARLDGLLWLEGEYDKATDDARARVKAAEDRATWADGRAAAAEDMATWADGRAAAAEEMSAWAAGRSAEAEGAAAEAHARIGSAEATAAEATARAAQAEADLAAVHATKSYRLNAAMGRAARRWRRR